MQVNSLGKSLPRTVESPSSDCPVACLECRLTSLNSFDFSSCAVSSAKEDKDKGVSGKPQMMQENKVWRSAGRARARPRCGSRSTLNLMRGMLLTLTLP